MRKEPRYRLYRRHLPHWREAGAIYFVTSRVARGQEDLEPDERTVVANAIRHFDGARYEIDAFVVMNDHVHVIVCPLNNRSVESIVHSWKSFTAHAIGRNRSSHGQLWQREYFDRVVGDARELTEKREYIWNNPFKRWQDLESYRWVWPDEE